MQLFPKISIITPNLNGGRYLENAILSVIGQNYPNLEYIVVDGGSSDDSLEIIRKHRDAINWFVSEKDHGMYDALQKGFRASTGSVMGWVNSDDVLQGSSLFELAAIFKASDEIHWVQGYPTVISETGGIVFHRPQVWSKYFFLLHLHKGGSFIQQESTFWTRDLWERAGACISDRYRYAGDFELWMRFFRYEKLYLTNTILGSFRIRKEGQISKDFYQMYLSECAEIVMESLVHLSEQEGEILTGFSHREPSVKENRSLELLLPPPPRVDFNLNTFRYELVTR